MEENIKSKVWWDEKEKIIRVKLCGDQDEADAKHLISTMYEIADKIPGKHLILNDMTEAGKPSVAAKKHLIQGTMPEKIEKMAFFGGNIVARVVAPFLMGSSGVKNVKFFSSEEKALKWLKEGRKS